MLVEALIVVREASDRICGKRRRLLPILVEAMERHVICSWHRRFARD